MPKAKPLRRMRQRTVKSVSQATPILAAPPRQLAGQIRLLFIRAVLVGFGSLLREAEEDGFRSRMKTSNGGN